MATHGWLLPMDGHARLMGVATHYPGTMEIEAQVRWDTAPERIAYATLSGGLQN